MACTAFSTLDDYQFANLSDADFAGMVDVCVDGTEVVTEAAIFTPGAAYGAVYSVGAAFGNAFSCGASVGATS